MNINEIILLENGKEYLILDDALFENKKYLFTVEIKNEEPTKNYLIFEEVLENNESFVKVVEDEKLKIALLGIFTINYGDAVDEIKKEVAN